MEGNKKEKRSVSVEAENRVLSSLICLHLFVAKFKFILQMVKCAEVV